MCGCVLLVSLSFLAGFLGVCFLSPIQKCLSGSGCDVPQPLGPTLVPGLLPLPGAGLDAAGTEQILPRCIEGRRMCPAGLGVLKTAWEHLCVPPWAEGPGWAGLLPSLLTQKLSPVPTSPVNFPQCPPEALVGRGTWHRGGKTHQC